jgi:hypothetical protein
VGLNSIKFSLQSKFFPAKIPFSKIQKKNLVGKKFTLQMNEVLFKFRDLEAQRAGLSSSTHFPTPKLIFQPLNGDTWSLKLRKRNKNICPKKHIFSVNKSLIQHII